MANLTRPRPFKNNVPMETDKLSGCWGAPWSYEYTDSRIRNGRDTACSVTRFSSTSTRVFRLSTSRERIVDPSPSGRSTPTPGRSREGRHYRRIALGILRTTYAGHRSSRYSASGPRPVSPTPSSDCATIRTRERIR